MTPILAISGLAADDPAFDVSDARDVAALLEAERRHFWHATRGRIVVDRLRQLGVAAGASVLDLGCGSGSVAEVLAGAGFDVTAVDGHRALLEVAARRDARLTLWQHDLRRGTGELPRRDFDVVGLFDVIEHLDDPADALRGALACVRPGGFLVGTVPALMLLWSAIDAHSGHKTRYRRASLRALLEGVAGARVVEVAPFNRALVPLMLAQRKVVGRRGDAESAAANLAVPPRALNLALGALVLAEHRARALLDRTPIEGSSLWFALRRG